jgi:hypothetical protein
MNEEDLRKNLAMAFVFLKEQQSELFEVRNQLAAVRDVMKSSPKFAEMFSERLEDWQNRVHDANAEMLAKFDEIILRLRDG